MSFMLHRPGCRCDDCATRSSNRQIDRKGAHPDEWVMADRFKDEPHVVGRHTICPITKDVWIADRKGWKYLGVKAKDYGPWAVPPDGPPVGYNPDVEHYNDVRFLE